MAKSKKQGKHLNKVAEKLKTETLALVERALQYMEDNHMDRTIATLSRVTKYKTVDPTGRGRSEGTLNAEYLQPLLKHYRIGKYAALDSIAEEDVIDPGDFIKLVKENKKLSKKLNEKIEMIKKLTKEKKQSKLQNEVLRNDNMELQTKLEISRNLIPANNT